MQTQTTPETRDIWQNDHGRIIEEVQQARVAERANGLPDADLRGELVEVAESEK
jgi:hypothetical protein